MTSKDILIFVCILLYPSSLHLIYLVLEWEICGRRNNVWSYKKDEKKKGWKANWWCIVYCFFSFLKKAISKSHVDKDDGNESKRNNEEDIMRFLHCGSCSVSIFGSKYVAEILPTWVHVKARNDRFFCSCSYTDKRV